MRATSRTNYVDLAAFPAHCLTKEWRDSVLGDGITFAVACNRHTFVPSMGDASGMVLILTEPLSHGP